MSLLLDSPALEQARLLRDGKVTSLELTKAYLAKIKAKNPELQAFSQVLERQALKTAKQKDKLLQKARKQNTLDQLPTFTGVPSGIKDLSLMKGTFSRMGSRAYRYLLAPIDSWVTKRMKDAGFVILGKLATSEFGAMPITEPEIHPPTRNPWNQGHSAGGSSGGTGSAVGSGLVPFAQGGDGAGSIRIPAAFCHCFGFKPSRTLNLCPAPKVDKFRFATVGPITNNVDDAAAMLDIMVGTHTYDQSNRINSYLEKTSQSIPKLKIRVCSETPLAKTEPIILEAVEEMAKQLERMGHDIEHVPALEASLEEFLPLWQRLLANVPVYREDLLQPVTRWLRENGKKISQEDNTKLFKLLEERVNEWFGDADIMLTPSVAGFAPEIGKWKHLSADLAFESAAELGAFTAPFNISGQPAASIPMGINSDNLPYAVQIAGKVGFDAEVLALSKKLEEVLPWRQRSL
ncbi:MAG: amidase [Halobacteriovoraceae bacterium]|nr:amidase [Halobacteriovoraceae bacterium]